MEGTEDDITAQTREFVQFWRVFRGKSHIFYPIMVIIATYVTKWRISGETRARAPLRGTRPGTAPRTAPHVSYLT